MTDIKSLGFPLVFKAATGSSAPAGLESNKSRISIRTAVRCLSGMQKQALVQDASSGTTWSMMSDEGPYLNGTDLAPFPLAFFTAGMAFSFFDKMMGQAVAAGVSVNDLKLTQDNYYTMQGSAIRGDMIGGALPVEMCLEVSTEAPREILSRMTSQALQRCPAQHYMSQKLTNTFALYHNGNPLPVREVAQSPSQRSKEPTKEIDDLRPLSSHNYARDIISKVAAAEAVFGVEGGAGSSLQATQKRTLHVRGICTQREDGLKEATVQLLKPIGSTFLFKGDDTGGERAPSSLAFLAAGIGFCFMTQIGRYAHITKQNLNRYSICQDTVYHVGLNQATAEPVDTHTYLFSNEQVDYARQTLRMSERTCFLHAAMRESNTTKIRII